MQLTEKEIELCKQWFAALKIIQNMTPERFLQADDFELAEKMGIKSTKTEMEITDFANELERIAELAFDDVNAAQQALKQIAYPCALPYLKDAVHQHVLLLRRTPQRGRNPGTGK